MDPMGARILPLTPRAQEFSGPVENHHRVFAAVEHINVVVGIDPDRADFLERPAVGQLRPVLDDAVPVLAGPDDDRHANSPDWCLSRAFHSTPYPSFPRKRESRAAMLQRLPWTPAFAGVTGKKIDITRCTSNQTLSESARISAMPADWRGAAGPGRGPATG